MTVIQAEDLRRLSEYENTTHPVVSLYLNVTPPRTFSTELNSLVHAKREELEKASLEENQRITLKEIFEKFKYRLEKTAIGLEGTRLLVVFADSKGLWQEFRIPVGLPSEMILGRSPHVQPLVMILERFKRYGVVVLDARKARMFSLFLGEVEEHEGLFEDLSVPSKVRVGMWAGLAESRIQRHVEDHIHRHLKEVAGRSFEFFRRMEFDSLIVGSPDDKTLPWFLDHLHSYLQERYIGSFHARPDEPLSSLKERALHIARSREQQEEKEIIDRLIEQQGRLGKAVIGLEPTLEALMLGQAHTVVIEYSRKFEGYFCPDDHFLSSSQRICPLCSRELDAIDVTDEIVREALIQAAEVKYIFEEDPRLAPFGIGAILRFIL